MTTYAPAPAVAALPAVPIIELPEFPDAPNAPLLRATLAVIQNHPSTGTRATGAARPGMCFAG